MVVEPLKHPSNIQKTYKHIQQPSVRTSHKLKNDIFVKCPKWTCSILRKISTNKTSLRLLGIILIWLLGLFIFSVRGMLQRRPTRRATRRNSFSTFFHFFYKIHKNIKNSICFYIFVSPGRELWHWRWGSGVGGGGGGFWNPPPKKNPQTS